MTKLSGCQVKHEEGCVASLRPGENCFQRAAKGGASRTAKGGASRTVKALPRAEGCQGPTNRTADRANRAGKGADGWYRTARTTRLRKVEHTSASIASARPGILSLGTRRRNLIIRASRTMRNGRMAQTWLAATLPNFARPTNGSGRVVDGCWSGAGCRWMSMDVDGCRRMSLAADIYRHTHKNTMLSGCDIRMMGDTSLDKSCFYLSHFATARIVRPWCTPTSYSQRQTARRSKTSLQGSRSRSTCHEDMPDARADMPGC